MTNKEIYSIYEGLCELSNNKELQFPIKISYILAKNKLKLESYYKAISDCEKKIWLQYGKQKEDGSIWMPNENIEKANQALQDLMEIDNNVNIETINIEDFGNINIQLDTLTKLMNMIKA